jgi:hypothetical protein
LNPALQLKRSISFKVHGVMRNDEQVSQAQVVREKTQDERDGAKTWIGLQSQAKRVSLCPTGKGMSPKDD